ncbi:MAG TPA: hypothetical protein DHW02_14840, partial [Ktedonobacter sp.]|nr:hypothetical protein [Ktedonobacter sp.]
QLEQIPFRRFKDYQILYDMYEQDIEQDYVDDKQRKFRSTEYGGFDVLKYFVFDDALKILEHKITDALRLNNDGIITIEFARNNYQHALKLFNPEFLRDAHVLFISCELEVCIQRIYERIRNGPRPDFHYVSDRIMRSYFSEDNIDYMAYFDEDALGYEGQHYK